MSTFREVAEAFSGHGFPDAGRETRAELAAITSHTVELDPEPGATDRPAGGG